MIEVEIRIPPAIKPDTLIQVVEQLCSDTDLLCALKGTLKAYPGCVHWHFRKTKQSGTLEITWWQKEHRLWFKVADHRASPWIEEILPILKKKIEQVLYEK